MFFVKLMKSKFLILRRQWVACWLGVGLVFSGFTQGVTQSENQPDQQGIVVEGKVGSLAGIGEQRGIKADLEPQRRQMAIECKDGRVIPLLSDEGGRLFYLDEGMRGREVRLKLRMSRNFPVAEVIHVEMQHEGRWRIPQYYCDVCTIAVRYPQTCLCCQGPMEFRLKPER